MSRHGFALLTVGAALALAGCGDPPTAAPSSSAATEAPATTTPNLKAAAEAAYLAAVKPDNAATDTFNAQLTALKGQSFAAAVPAMTAFVKATQTFEAALFQIQYPPEAMAASQALASSLAALIGAGQDFIATPNQATWSAFMAANTKSSGDANALRLALGLPPVS